MATVPVHDVDPIAASPATVRDRPIVHCLLHEVTDFPQGKEVPDLFL